MAGSVASPVNRRHLRLAAALVCLAAALPYASTLHDYFVNDDFGVVQLLSRKPLGYFPRWFVTSWMEDIWGYLPDEIRPFPALSYQLASVAAPTWPVANHVINIAFHAGNGLLVLALARAAAGLGLPAATFAALAFVLLPVHAESVAWITGRVDTFPAFFYLASFLLYVRWRGGAGERSYAGSLLLFFVALFSKQNTITMVVTLALYDTIVLGRRVQPTWTWIRPYVPYGLMTLGYLALRYALFGEVVRERQLNASGFDLFAQLAPRHLAHVVFGSVKAGSAAGWLGVGLAIAGCAWWSRRNWPTVRPTASAVFWYFGPAWWLIGIAPVAVAGYESPRHVYLAAVGWAILLGLAGDITWRTSGARAWRATVAALAALVLAGYAVPLQAVVARWNHAAALSEQMVRDVEREALAARPGTLLVLGAPATSWEWALPFSARPPYTATDLHGRAFIITPMKLHCCRHLWAGYTRDRIGAWERQPEPGGIVALAWDEKTGARFRVTDVDYPALRSIVSALPSTGGPDAMDQALLRLMVQVVRAYPASGQRRRVP